MDLFARFKQDYFNYLISFILPAIVTGISIPVFKRILGSEGYGVFAIWSNAALITVAILAGWITNSILRFYAANENKAVFVRKAIRLSFYTQLSVVIPSILILRYFSGDWLFSVFFSFALLSIALQFTVAAVCQAGFLSKKIMFMETIRVGSYVSLALLLLLFSDIYYLYVLFFATVVGYVSSAIYLYKQLTKASLISNNDEDKNRFDRPLAKKFFAYGAPFSFWFVFSFLLAYIDKVFMSKNIGPEVQGNYQAIFDIISRAITILIYPVITSLFPILTKAFENGELIAIKKLLKKIMLYEIAGFAITSALYWLFGAKLLLLILKTPDTFNYRLMGFIIIAGTFIWQMAIVIQKHFELKLKSFLLLRMVTVAFAVQLSLYLFLGNSTNQLLYPLGYLASAIVYLILVSYSEFKILLKPAVASIKTRLKDS